LRIEPLPSSLEAKDGADNNRRVKRRKRGRVGGERKEKEKEGGGDNAQD
jgi:hypothetical protein